MKRLREGIVGMVGAKSPLADLVECGWCAGWWVTAGCRIARRVAPAWWGPFAEAMAAAFVASYLVGKSREEGDPKDIAEAIEDTGGEKEEDTGQTQRVDLDNWEPPLTPRLREILDGDEIWRLARQEYETNPKDPVEIMMPDSGGGCLSIPRAMLDESAGEEQ